MNTPALLRSHSLASASVCALLAAGGLVRASETPASAAIVNGSAIYTDNCATCHNRGKAGAPRVSELAEWEPRLKRGRDTLVKHAIKGFSGPAGDEMPARGGNDDLTDAEVTAAVDHILLLLKPNNTSKSTTP